MELVARLGYLFTEDRAFGEADTYVVGALGACFGLMGLYQLLLYSLIASMFFIVPAFLYKQYQQNNKTLCILFILFTLSALAFKNISQDLYTLGALFITGILLVIFILKKLKNDPCPLYLPLVPAFAIGTLYFLFF
jgi:membrane associated rhomboid family serine protease